MLLVKNAEIYSPEYLGKKDVVIAGGKIEEIGGNIEISKSFSNVEVIDGEGKYLFPGFIDSHVHILGGGGEDGFHSRTPEINLSDITSAGITTVVGCLGTDSVTRDMRSLLAKARALEEDGITTYIFTGSYDIPVRSMFNEPDEDIVLIDKVVGIGEVALSDHRSSQPTYEEFIRVVAKARVGGLLSGKAGIVDIHMGGGKAGLKYLFRMLKETEISVNQVLPTHVNRCEELMREAVEYAKIGGLVDITTSSDSDNLEPGEELASESLKYFLDNGVPIENIQFTSDGQGSLPIFRENGELKGIGIGRVDSLYREVRAAILNKDIPIEQALKLITSNVAKNFKFAQKGRIKQGLDGDLVLVDKQTLKIKDVICMGNIMIKDEEIIKRGTFETNTR
ncbi:beta-aspartyl-peptidase [Clostridium sp. 19966]|uniref:beta-aspartyl-peptidase n=1 Tax=Clostridium sp. 19966 TaxID=2768166 RepID=UPI0028DF6C00|nr:beta-aspartyl-peptidase [Clostridium sp. 19966]MDT8715859.1 beta-aspartyl-peptidase [Clostridium sp. 19966]